MKKLTAIILVVFLAFAAFAGCSSKSSNDTSAPSYGESGAYPQAPPAPGGVSGGGSLTEQSDKDGGWMYDNGQTTTGNTGLADKIIYNASAGVETVDFDSAVNGVYAMLNEFGAFLESSYVSGSDYRTTYYGRTAYRYATFEIRVPSSAFSHMTDGLANLGNVLYLSMYTENITAQFYDLEARLKTYLTEEERLLNMLASADTIEEMILIEERLSNVRYNIESAQTTLTYWQSQVDYSTVSLRIDEVEELTEKVETHLTFGEEIKQGLQSTLRSIGRFFKNLAKDVVILLPVIIIIVICVFIVVGIAIRIRRRRRLRRTKLSGDLDADENIEE